MKNQERKKPRVLIVDDEPQNLRIIGEFLGDLDIDIVTACNGKDAIIITEKTDLAVILLDIQLPDMTGFVVAEMIRNNENTKSIPIIFVSGHFTGAEYQHLGYQHGAVGFLTKPIDKAVLLSKISFFCSSYQKNQQLSTEIETRLIAESKLIETNQRLDEKVMDRTAQLRERVKELDCLYGVSLIIDRNLNNLDQALYEIVRHISSGWQYPEITCARIIVDSNHYESDDFKETEWMQKEIIDIEDQCLGSVSIYYKKEMPELYEGPFLKEERVLISSISKRLGLLISKERGQKELVNSGKQIKSLSQRILISQEQEREYIARDLHDSIGQLLATLRLDVEFMLKSAESESIREDLNNFINITMSGTEELKRICMGLRPVALDKVGLTAAVEELLSTYEGKNSLVIESDIDIINSYEISQETAINIYRIIQEAMNNIIKHSEASKASIEVLFKKNVIEARIADDGKGFDTECNIDKGLQYGILGMTERAELCNGTLSIDSSSEQGTKIVFTVPTGVDK